jgi:hypothetical protein
VTCIQAQPADKCAQGSYPNVFNNESVDPSFGVTAPVVVEQLTRAIAKIDAGGDIYVKPVNAYSGNNGRAVILHNWVYYMADTVYQVGDAGRLQSFATAATTRITILPGFSTTLANSKTGAVYHPFGIWFANPTTLYVADEGDGNLNNAATGFGGLQKWNEFGVRARRWASSGGCQVPD